MFSAGESSGAQNSLGSSRAQPGCDSHFWPQLSSLLRGFSGGGEGKSVKEWWKKPQAEIWHLPLYLGARQIFVMKLEKYVRWLLEGVWADNTEKNTDLIQLGFFSLLFFIYFPLLFPFCPQTLLQWNNGVKVLVGRGDRTTSVRA